MIPWLQGMGGKPPDIVARFMDARQLNSVLGGVLLTPWDVEQLPDEDIRDILGYVHTSGEVLRVKNG